MPHAYSEDQLIEQPAIGLFAELGWQTVSAMEEVFSNAPHPSPLPKGEGVYLGRETPGEVVLVPRLCAALVKLNPQLPPDAISTAPTTCCYPDCFRVRWYSKPVDP